MAEAAGDLHEERAAAPRWRSVAEDVATKLFLTLVAAAITAVLIPWITGRWQDHKQQLELRTTLATDMSRAYTDAIVRARFVAGGLVYSADHSAVATTNAWTDAFRAWLGQSGTLTAQLTGRYPTDTMPADWRAYAGAVTTYLRLGSQPDAATRATLLAGERRYTRTSGIDLRPLRAQSHFKQAPGFRSTYNALGEWLLARGDALVQQELRLSPRV